MFETIENDEFTFLSKEHIKNGYVLKEKYKTNIPTDFASFLCGLDSEKCTSWTCSSNNNAPYYIDENGQIKPYKLDLKILNDVFIRPVLPYYDLKSIKPKGKVFYDETHTLIIEYGWYPQDYVEYSISKKLESLYLNNHSLERSSNHFHHFKAVKQLESLPEYKFEGKYYVNVGITWFEVKPVRWIVDEENHLLVSENCLISRVPYAYPDMIFDNDFRKTNIHHFLNDYFKHDLLQRHSYLLNYNLDNNSNIIMSGNESITNINDKASRNVEKSIKTRTFYGCNLKQLILSKDIRYIGFQAFGKCPELDLNIETSLFYFLPSNDNLAVTFDVKHLTVYGHKIESIADLKNVQKLELQDKIKYVLSKHNFKFNQKLFDKKIRDIVDDMHSRVTTNEDKMKHFITVDCEYANYEWEKQLIDIIYEFFERHHLNVSKISISNYLLNNSTNKVDDINTYKTPAGVKTIYEGLIPSNATKLIISSDVTKIEEKSFPANLKEIVFEDGINLNYFDGAAFDNMECNKQIDKIIIPYTLNYIDYLFVLKNHIKQVEFESSLFHSYVSVSFGQIKFYDDVVICMSDRELKNAKGKLKSIQHREYLALMQYILNRYDLEYDSSDDEIFEEYVKESLYVFKNCFEDYLGWKKLIINSIYNKIKYKKVFNGFLTKKKVINDIKKYMDEFYASKREKVLRIKGLEELIKEEFNKTYVDEGYIEERKYYYNDFESLDLDLSNVYTIDNCAFEGCINLKKLLFTERLEWIGTNAFYNCHNLELEIKSSLFYIDVDTITCVMDDRFRSTFDVKKLTIFGKSIDLYNSPYETFINIQKEEYIMLVTYILKKYKLEYDYNYFLNNKNIEPIIKEDTIYDYENKYAFIIEDVLKCIFNKKPLLRLKKEKIKEEISIFIDEFYNKSRLKKEALQIQNNPFINNTCEEVLDSITNLELSSLDTTDIHNFLKFGSELTPYFDYISNSYSKVTFNNSLNMDKTSEIRKKIDYYSKNLLEIDNSFINEFGTYLDEVILNTESEIENLSSLKQIMNIYISKLEKMKNELNTNIINIKENNLISSSNAYLINSNINSKLNSIQILSSTIIEEYMEISLLLSNSMTFYETVNSIKTNFFPKLIMSINIKTSSNYKNEIVTGLNEINSMLDIKTSKKISTNLEKITRGIKDKFKSEGSNKHFLVFSTNKNVKSRFLTKKLAMDDEVDDVVELDEVIKFVKENNIEYRSPFLHEELGMDKNEESFYTLEQVEKLLKIARNDVPPSDSNSIMSIKVSHDTEISIDPIKHNSEAIVNMFDDESKTKKLKK